MKHQQADDPVAAASFSPLVITNATTRSSTIFYFDSFLRSSNKADRDAQPNPDPDH